MNSSTTNPVIRLNNVHHRFGKKPVLDGVSFELPQGETLALLGSNGAGKTTLLNLLLGLFKPKSGTAEVLGLTPHKHGRKLRPQVGFVPAIPDVYDWMTPRDLYRFLAPQYRTWNAAAVDEDIERLSVPMDIRFRDLSRGQAMKAMTIAALGFEPPLLLLDEPFAGLDPTAREDLLAALLERIDTGRQSILIATHNLEMAARLADRVVILHEGRVTQAGPIDQLVPEAQPPKPLPRGLHELFVRGTQDQESVR
ncbi:MAG: ABC transporter ATP-binding protein [Planctomycetota bacterium]